VLTGSRPGVKAIYGVLAAILLAYWASLIVRGSGGTTTWLDGWGVASYELVVSGLVLARGMLAPHDRPYAVLLGVGGCLWALGDFATTRATLGGATPPSPSLGNVLWAGFFPFGFLGLLTLLRRDVVKVATANVLDGVIVVLLAATGLAEFGFHAIMRASGEPLAWVATNLVYPVMDVPVVALSVLGIVLLTAGNRGRWYLLTAAGVMNLAGDGVALFPNGVGSSQLGFVLNSAAWPTSLFLISCAVYLAREPATEPRSDNRSGFVIPATAAGVALLIVLIDTATHAGAVVAVFAVLTVAAAGARCGLALRHLNGLTERRHGELEQAAAAEQQRHDELEQLQNELTTQLDGADFAHRLSRALEIADEEDDVFDVVERAAVDISEQTPMELLLADSSRANLARAASNPTQPAPGCPVKSPYSCVAVRRGTVVTFESSEALDACPHLRGRETGPCSATCVPVTFMGRALGVLHSTGPDEAPLANGRVNRLSVLAEQAGVRIGTVRAFQKSQLQASTDALTGLVNRRTAEEEVRGLIDTQRLFAVAIADLDKFKQLNDTYGHEAGDRALRLFAQTATNALRDNDVVARWGGEEFVIVLPELDRYQAVSVVDRIRRDLAAAHSGQTAVFTSSFGVADSRQASTLEALMSIADAGLYQAKEGGRDRAVVAEASDVEPADPETAAIAPDGEPLVLAHTRLPSIQQAGIEREPPSNGVQIR
jgi:diguanylate cyclase (GGDEF)-like protein